MQKNLLFLLLLYVGSAPMWLSYFEDYKMREACTKNENCYCNGLLHIEVGNSMGHFPYLNLKEILQFANTNS